VFCKLGSFCIFYVCRLTFFVKMGNLNIPHRVRAGAQEHKRHKKILNPAKSPRRKDLDRITGLILVSLGVLILSFSRNMFLRKLCIRPQCHKEMPLFTKLTKGKKGFTWFPRV